LGGCEEQNKEAQLAAQIPLPLATPDDAWAPAERLKQTRMPQPDRVRNFISPAEFALGYAQFWRCIRKTEWKRFVG
jgi:hypothetical protein